jgi:DNA phosphorothioation-dependent restriction protein DptG
MAYTATHRQQVDERKSVQDTVALVHEMYDCLGHYGQKVPTPDQVKHDDLQGALQEFLQELAQVGALLNCCLALLAVHCLHWRL